CGHLPLGTEVNTSVWHIDAVRWEVSITSAYGPCGLPLIYSPFLLKLPVLAASKSLRRSRKAGAARMDAG
ncbi:hypothetical protein, partial [Klebsiella quasivariicola]|uniref:hypothetical protein n=2 Tax=Klebsiella quasivariicola TaxID=2026240 RepID=UPI001C6E4483